MRLEETTAHPNPSDPGHQVRKLSFDKFVVLGFLALDGILLQQFIGVNREYLSPSSTASDLGLTIPGSEIPTTQFIICALAMSIPCLSILAAHYAFVAKSADVPGWMENLLWMVGTSAAAIALSATFWFLSQVSSVIFIALSFLFYSTYMIALQKRSRKALIYQVPESALKSLGKTQGEHDQLMHYETPKNHSM